MRLFVLAILFLTVSASELVCQTFGYVPNRGDNTVSVFDVDTNVVVATIGVGNAPFGVAVSPDRSRAYITNIDDQLVSVIDASSNTVVATISFMGEVTLVAITPDGTKGYVTLTNNTLSAFSTATNLVTADINLGVGDLVGVAITPDGAKVYAAAFQDALVKVIDVASDTEIGSINTTYRANIIAINPEGTKGYVTIESDDEPILVFDTGSDTIIATITGFDRQFAIAISPTESKAYAVGPSPTAIVIDTLTDSLSSFFTVGSSAVGVAFSEDGSRAYISNDSDGNVSVVNAATNTVIATITVGTSPGFLAVGPLTGGDNFALRAAGEAKRDSFLTQVDLFNVIRWTQGSSAITQYKVYRDSALTDLVATLAAGEKRVFEDHNRSPNTTYTYYIVGLAGSSAVQQASVSVTTGN